MPLRAFFVAAAIEGRNQVRGDFSRLLKNGVCRIGVDAVGQGRQACPHGRGVEHFVQDKAHVAQRGFEFGHNVNLVGTIVLRAQRRTGGPCPFSQWLEAAAAPRPV
ncbi:hypothetical protein D3C84_426440 [compost metagenome]